jgi:predicted transcriptional regulator
MGAFLITEVIEASPTEIWKRFGSVTGLSKAEFDNYFAGIKTGFAMAVGQTWRLPEAIHLATLRRNHRGFHPPQGYRYLAMPEVLRIGGEALLGGKGCASDR